MKLTINFQSFSLPNGMACQFQWPSQLTEEEFEDLVYQLEGIKNSVLRDVRGSKPVDIQGGADHKLTPENEAICEAFGLAPENEEKESK